MKKLRAAVGRSVLMAVIAAGGQRLKAAELENDLYRITLRTDGSVAVTTKATSASQIFQANFLLLSRMDDPGYSFVPDRQTAYRVPSWKIGDKNRTTNVFEPGKRTLLAGRDPEYKGDRIHWRFPRDPDITFHTELELPPGKAQPKMTFHFTPQREGWYSVGFRGAPEVDPKKLTSLWQPLVWQEQRFPANPFLSVESMCSLPAVLAETHGVTFGVAADPSESPFRLPTLHNSLFGVALRNDRGLAQPMIFAPVLGLENSKMPAGQKYSFSFRLVLSPGTALDTFATLARSLYQFRDHRENASCSLNETIENMIDYAMNDTLSGWIAELRGSDYATDVPGTVKNVSALHPLSIALVTDNEDIYHRRGLPMTEYLLSRQKYLFATSRDITGQNASYLMKGPAAEVSELAALFLMFQGRSEVFRHYAIDLYAKPRALNLNMVSEGKSWQNSLALFRLTDDKTYLDQAISGAEDYIRKRVDTAQEDFSDVHVETGGQFWTDFAPKWIDLFELYEETRNDRFLAAALHGARLFSTYAWYFPCIPEQNVMVNKGGHAGMFYTRRMANPQPMLAPEQAVPAWRVSQIGLLPEASTTYAGNPAILLTHHAPYMLRLGAIATNSFLHDLGRSAVVGRYANFPGYDINGEFSTVYQRPDYPLRPWDQLTFNNIYYNHIWPMIAMDMDFLISDAVVRSGGKIDFPSRYAQGYAYLQSKVYGDRPGRFYGDENVRLWLPRKLLRTDSIQANYVAGYGNNSVYLALMNQSQRPAKLTVTFNPDIVPVDMSRRYPVRVWMDNRAADPTLLVQGQVVVALSPAGITALKLEGIKVTTQFQDRVFIPDSASASAESFSIQNASFGRVTSMLLSMSPRLTSAYVWLDSTPREITSATLHYASGTLTGTATDGKYPFEFSIPLPRHSLPFEFWIEATTSKGETTRTEPVRLKQ